MGYPIYPRIPGVPWQGTTSMLGIRRPVGSVRGRRTPSAEARELLEHKHPQFRTDPNQEGKRTRSSRKLGITTLKSLQAKGAGRGSRGLGEIPLACNPLGWRVRRGCASNRASRGVLGLHPRISHPARGVPWKESPPLPIIPAPNPSTLRAVAPAPWLAVAAPEPFEAPSPLPWPSEPPPQLRPPPRRWLRRARPAAPVGRRVCHFRERGGTRGEDLELPEWGDTAAYTAPQPHP